MGFLTFHNRRKLHKMWTKHNHKHHTITSFWPYTNLQETGIHDIGNPHIIVTKAELRRGFKMEPSWVRSTKPPGTKTNRVRAPVPEAAKRSRWTCWTKATRKLLPKGLRTQSDKAFLYCTGQCNGCCCCFTTKRSFSSLNKSKGNFTRKKSK